MPREAKPLKTRRHPAKLAEVAWRELGLSITNAWSQADIERYWRIWRGLEFLDNEQTRIKVGVDDLIEAFEAHKRLPDFIKGLRALTKPINEEAVEEYEKELVTMSFGDATTIISDLMEDIEDFDEIKIKNLLELLLDKPVKITTGNPRLKPTKKRSV